MFVKKVYIILFTALMIACSVSPSQSDQHDIVGTWVFKEGGRNAMTFVKKRKLKRRKYGVAFEANGEATVRQMTGPCGVPPIPYGNHAGTWAFASDSTLTITYEGSWRRDTIQEVWLIKDINHYSLTVKRLNQSKS